MEMKNKCVVTNECFGFVLLESVFPKEIEKNLFCFFASMYFVSRYFLQ